jgi:hypothetical protein
MTRTRSKSKGPAMTRTRAFKLPEYAASDEAAAYIADMLMEIALQFEAAHFSQIRRHCQSLEPEPDDNPGGQQLDLFDKHPFDRDPPF